MKFGRFLPPFFFSLMFVDLAHAQTEFVCAVSRKIDGENTYTPAEIERARFSVRVVEGAAATSVSRCSFSLQARRATCDTYSVDYIAHDLNIDAKKYYVFRSQFDIQIFRDLTFVENNGRGSVAFGQCEAL